MKRTNMPLEALVTRWEDRREIQNLMGRYTYALLLKQEKDIFDIYWCQNAEAPCLGLNSGYYKGYGAIQSYPPPEKPAKDPPNYAGFFLPDGGKKR